MSKDGPIIVIEDDIDDQGILAEVFKRLNIKNEIVFLSNGDKAIDYLATTTTNPFIILSDVNMPKINGFELKEKIRRDEKVALKYIPYLFFTTGAHKQLVNDAYALSAQGFFLKPIRITDLENTIKTIVAYWSLAVAPDEFD